MEKDKSEVEIGDSETTAIFNFFCTLYCFLRFLLGLASDCPFFPTHMWKNCINCDVKGLSINQLID